MGRSGQLPRPLVRLSRWIAANVELARCGEWREVVLGYWISELRRWRCHLFGHRFGPEEREYEDAGYPVHASTWRTCQRKNCSAACEEWSVYGPARGVLG